MKVLVCGGRAFKDYDAVCAAMSEVISKRGSVSHVIHGGAHGADSMAGRWARSNGVHEVIVPALWDKYRKSAGVLRNVAMLQLSPDLCVAFPGGNGTSDMVFRVIRAGIEVWEPAEGGLSG